MDKMVKEIKGLPISDATARLIASLRLTEDIYDNIMHALMELYGEHVGGERTENKCLKLFNEVDSLIRELISESISYNIEKEYMETI